MLVKTELFVKIKGGAPGASLDAVEGGRGAVDEVDETLGGGLPVGPLRRGGGGGGRRGGGGHVKG